jgi:hypothetical protein
MSYYIDIIDTTSPLTQIVVENASASGIVLNWNGGDTKDETAIVSSELNFDMLTKTADDAAFINFFTGDEHRFKVMIKDSVDDAIIWQGYVLPDLYSEPYKNVCFFVSFTATDGLGRLKGKYLPEEYYSREKSLIDIYCQILKLTGIELDLYFLPAIENFINKDWNTIYINTENFVDNKKKKDAYSILETLLQDTLCVCYQADNRWYIEGLNQRNVRQVACKKYNTEGVFVENVAYNRLLKNITPLVTPMITIIPPYNEITVTHKKVEVKLPATLSKEVNDGWAFVTGVKGEITANDWMQHGSHKILIPKNPDYNCIIYNLEGANINNPQDDTQWISLKEKIFIAKGQKVKISFAFIIKKLNTEVSAPSDMTLWKNPFKYEIFFNGVLLYSNFGGTITDFENVIFDESGNAALDIEHIFIEDGLFDIKIYGPPGTIAVNKIHGIQISKADLSIIGFEEEEIITDLISGDFTIDKEIDLTYADDKSGYSSAFRLAKLKEQTGFFNEIVVPILYGFTLNEKNYSVVQLEGAFLIAKNKYQVYKDAALVTVNDVIYNFNNGEQMVIETDVLHSSGSFTVKKYAVDDLIDSRAHWIQWTDAIYKIENSSYSKTVANIYRRIFNQAVEKLDVTALDAVKFNDIVLFKYVYEKDFFVLNCSWNLDENKTTLTLGRSHYKNANSTTPGDENIPPIVLAGDDIYIEDGITTASLLATAYDPDGYIASQIWTKTVGGFGDVIETPWNLDTNLQNLTEDFYTYQIQVTDNDGATAVDTVNVIRIKNYTVTLDLFSETIDTDVNHPSIIRKYKLNFSPELLPGFIITFSGSVYLMTAISGTYGVDGYSKYEIFKNGNSIEIGEGSYPGEIIGITLNYIAGDEIFIELTTSAQAGDLGSGDTATTAAELTFASSIVTSGVGNIIGLPTTKTQTVSVP